ncbi:MAG: SCO family protein [Zoogloeaceae bacterium]|jgi:protein SCO1/2|nr:SCO family protein [Zoogloeaceae bacterium]
MRMIFALLAALGLSVGSAAAAEEDPGLTAVRELGRVNGQALACGEKDMAAWARLLMLRHAPKTREYGERYEEATQEAFIAHGRGQPCPATAQLAARLDAAAQGLQAALPAADQAAADQTPPGHNAGAPPPNGIVPRYLLQDPNGRAVTNEDFAGRFQLIAFGYVSCPDVCPTTLLEMKEVLQRLGAAAARLQPVFITVDPERDSAQILREYTAAFDPRILGLRGNEALTRRAAAEFGVRYEKARDPSTPDSYTVDHSTGMTLLGPDGRALTRFPYAMPSAQIAERIQTLMQENTPRPPQ